jgi:hypothetical protein
MEGIKHDDPGRHDLKQQVMRFPSSIANLFRGVRLNQNRPAGHDDSVRAGVSFLSARAYLYCATLIRSRGTLPFVCIAVTCYYDLRRA